MRGEWMAGARAAKGGERAVAAGGSGGGGDPCLLKVLDGAIATRSIQLVHWGQQGSTQVSAGPRAMAARPRGAVGWPHRSWQTGSSVSRRTAGP